MKETPEMMREVLVRLKDFEHFGLPKTKEGLAAYAGSVCRMIFDQPHRPSPAYPEGMKALETLDATIKEAMDTWDGPPAPSPAALRVIYKQLGFCAAEQTPAAIERERWLYYHPGSTDEDYYWWKTNGKEYVSPEERKRRREAERQAEREQAN